MEASIKRLGSAPDAFAMHRMDPNVEIEETVSEMEALRKEGKTKYLGLSEVSSNVSFAFRILKTRFEPLY